MNLLVTTGGTVTFKKLVQFVATDDFIDLIKCLGITRVSIQYGNQINGSVHKSHEYINQCFSQCNYIDPISNLTDTVIIGDLVVELFPYSNEILSYINNADIIISHGGTGTIIDILKLDTNDSKPPKLMVVYNDQLMDNHQLEIALQFSDLHYCVSIASSNLCVETVRSILSGLIDGTTKLMAYKPANTTVLQSILVHELSN